MKKKSLYILFFILLAGMLLPSGTVEAAGKVKLNKTSVTLVKEKTATIKLVNAPKLAKMSKKDKKNLKWTTSNARVVKITTGSKSVKQVKVKALKAGKATIKAKYKGKTYKCKVTVKKADNGASKKPESTTEDTSGNDETTEASNKAVPVPDQPTDKVLTVYAGEKAKLSFHLSDGDKSAYMKSNGSVLLSFGWCTVADETVVTSVYISGYEDDCKGYFEALKPGTTTITAKDKVSGLTFTWTVKVVESPYKQKYTYSSYVLGPLYRVQMHSGQVITSRARVYIRTDNPGDGERKMVLVFMNGGGKVEYTWTEITQENAASRRYFSKGVTGGYLIEVNDTHQYGDWYIREYDVDGKHYYDTPLCAVQWENCNEQYDQWLEDTIARAGIKDSMTVPEKVEMLARYVNDNFYYGFIGKTYEENQKMGFMMNQADSFDGPLIVKDMAQKLGITVRSMYGDFLAGTDEWKEWHYKVELDYNGTKYYYDCCPPAARVYNKEAICEDVDLSKYK
ncbi:MAG: Ig-like domain-containing protein [Bacteroidales bacterium]|nr:Ig-like domain-containing protein [Clostridium sp.]MCM1203629.1 Ig-like domain-containing protein [Bacteroidales bacterium]